jgi:hypothetical protein
MYLMCLLAAVFEIFDLRGLGIVTVSVSMRGDIFRVMPRKQECLKQSVSCVLAEVVTTHHLGLHAY